MATEIASAYIKLIPTTTGIKSTLSEALTSAGDSAGTSAGTSAGNKFASALGTAAKAAGAGIVAAGTAVGALAKSAISSYADWEQLVGGVETLFGDSADVIQEYANSAFETAGLSANDYMETVTSFAASLVSSLDGDTAAAAEYANMAITDMSDNANKMGTDMESVQNAYQGFAKQNYTMLDNLKLGYGGTKEEMERLLEDATAISGIEYDVSSYSDIVDAIHVIQTEMGITGTTAEEASTTISGSWNSLKAAWENMLVGFAGGGADFDELIQNMVDSAATLFDNVLPVAEQALNGIADFVNEIAPIVQERLPEIIETCLPTILDSGANILMALINGIVASLPTLVAMVPDIIISIADTLAANLPQIIQAGVETIDQLVRGLTNALPSLVSAAWNIGKSIVQGVWKGIKSLWSSFMADVSNFFTSIVNTVKNKLGIHSPSTVFAGIGGNVVQGLANGILDGRDAVADAMDAVIDDTLTAGSGLQARVTVGASAISGWNAPGYAATNSAAAGTSNIVFTLADNAGNILARTTAGALDSINGNDTTLRARGLAI